MTTTTNEFSNTLLEERPLASRRIHELIIQRFGMTLESEHVDGWMDRLNGEFKCIPFSEDSTHEDRFDALDDMCCCILG